MPRNPIDEDRQVFDDVFDAADERESNRQLVEQMSQTEGWDGQALSDEEQLAQLAGASPEGLLIDRPLQYQHEQEMAARDQAWNQALERERANHRATYEKYAPEVAAEREQQKTNYWDNAVGAMPYDDGKADRFIAGVEQLKQQNAALMIDRAERQMEAARDRYGDDYSDTYDAIRALPDYSPQKNQILQHTFSAPDPGEALMGLRGSPALRQAPPFARSHDQRFAPREVDYARARQPTYDDLVAAADSDYGGDGAIYNDVFRRRR